METNLSKKNKLIKQISKASDMVPFSDFLLEFMDRYGLNNLRESTVEQLEELGYSLRLPRKSSNIGI